MIKNVYYQLTSIGGEEAILNEFPWAALLHLRSSKNNKTSRCGGSLISDRHILTAGHCIRKTAESGEIDYEYDDITVVLGKKQSLFLNDMFFFQEITIWIMTQKRLNSNLKH